MTNGTKLFVDGAHEGPWARRFRDLVQLHEEDLGPHDSLSELQRSLCRRVATLEVELEQMEGKLSKGEDVDLELYRALTGTSPAWDGPRDQAGAPQGPHHRRARRRGEPGGGALSFRDSPHPLSFFGLLHWIDGRPLMDTIEPYRREILSTVLYDFDGDRPRYNFALTGRGKKNFKTSDLILATLYRFIAWQSPAGNDCFTLANDEGQAADDLKLAKLLIAANPDLGNEVRVLDKEIVRKDGRGTLSILPARDSAGAHGKTYSICGFDEIHAYRGHEIFEALAQDPTRHDSLMWITAYNSMNAKPGVPLYDFLKAGREGSDERMYFSWYAGDYTTDPALWMPRPRRSAPTRLWRRGETPAISRSSGSACRRIAIAACT